MASAQYEVCKFLGEGGFGKVFLIEDKDDRSIQHAMKLMELGKMSPQELDLAKQEILLLSALDHERVLAYVTCFQEDNILCIVTEFCPNGDLSDYIQNQHGTPLEEARLIEWFRQIASAIEYLHSKNIIHRDLKVQNIFLDANMDCKLGDFGIARILSSATDCAQTQIGTMQYMSPEIFMGIPYNAKTDIWSLSVMIYELATLEKPFESIFIPQLIFKVTHGEKPDMPSGYRPEFATLLSKMMEKDPADRPSAADIMRDALFKGTAKPKPMPNLKSLDDYASTDLEAGPLNIDSFLQTIGDMSVPGRKTKGGKPGPKNKLHPKPVPAHGNRIGDEDTGACFDPMMDLVTRTLKDMGHNTVRPAGKTHMEQQIDMLKMYILNVLDNNLTLFNKANKELDLTRGHGEPEEKLIRILGDENFGLCGVELLHYKNFTFNLKNMK